MNTRFTQYSILLAAGSAVATIAGGFFCLLLKIGYLTLPDPASNLGEVLRTQYNSNITTLWLVALITLVIIILGAYYREPVEPKTNRQIGIFSFSIALKAIARHPFLTALLAAYICMMVSESSWFYKEIVTWFDDIHNGLQLNNFSFHQSFIGESMGKNNFRFFPLSHQDLHFLSWFTSYPKIWALVSATELLTTIALSIAIIKRASGNTSNRPKSDQYLPLIIGILYLSTSSSAYNYFQFIYSERVLTLLLALFVYHWQSYRQTGNVKAGYLAILWALLGSFFKDTAILLFVIPAAVNLAFTPLRAWRSQSKLELHIFSLGTFFLASYTWLSLLPSLYLNEQSYDANLRFSTLELDIRTVILLVFTFSRSFYLLIKKDKPTQIDCINFGAFSYLLALWALVGFKSTSYMALPIHLVVVMDVGVAWINIIQPWLSQNCSRRTAGAIGVGLSLSIVAVEHRFAHHFQERFTSIRNTQRSWRATFDQAHELAAETRRRGEPVNLIFSKSWFKHSDYLRTLPFDRLVYIDPDSGQSRIVEGIDRGQPYQAQAGDLFLDIDSGKKLKKFGIDLSQYQLIYEFDPKVSNGHIYRREAE